MLCELKGLSIVAVLLPLWDGAFYYVVFYCCWNKLTWKKQLYKMKPRTLDFLPPPVKALQSACMFLYVYTGTDVNYRSYAAGLRSRLFRVNKAIAHMAL